MGLNEFINSPEFKRNSATATDSAIKTIFKGAEIGIKALISFLRDMFKMIVS